jgi:hypothetical protein
MFVVEIIKCVVRAHVGTFVVFQIPQIGKPKIGPTCQVWVFSFDHSPLVNILRKVPF